MPSEENIKTGRSAVGIRTESGLAGQNYSTTQRDSNMKNFRPIILIAIVLLVIASGLIMFRQYMGFGKDAKNTAGGFQAVFLTNGQVYFGKLSAMGRGGYMKLNDIYYLQVQNPPIQGSQQQASQQQPQLQLVKLGNELHGPEDEMFISRSQVLFYENLKEDGKVMQAIKEYQANPNKQSSAPQVPAAAQTQAQTQQQPAAISNSATGAQTTPTGNR